MDGLLAGLLSGAGQGLSDVAENDIKQQNAMDLANLQSKNTMDLAAYQSKIDLMKQEALLDLQHTLADKYKTQDEQANAGLLQAGRDQLATKGTDYNGLSAHDKLVADANILLTAGKMDDYDKMIARAKNVTPEAKLDVIDGKLVAFDPSTGKATTVYDSGASSELKDQVAVERAAADPSNPNYAVANQMLKRQLHDEVARAISSGGASFEAQRAQWLKDNPGKTPADYWGSQHTKEDPFIKQVVIDYMSHHPGVSASDAYIKVQSDISDGRDPTKPIIRDALNNSGPKQPSQPAPLGSKDNPIQLK